MSATEYRAQFDAVVSFSNGGGLRADGFRVDVPGPDVTEQDVASLFIASLNLLMVEAVELRNLGVFAEPHKGTQGGPSDRPAPGSLQGRIVDLSHPIHDGLITFPGLPAPQIRPHLTRAQSRSRYEPGTEFQIDAITMVGNTGTYLDSPFHRYADGLDLATLPLESCVELPAVLARTAGPGSRTVDVGALAALEVAGRAVLLHTGGDAAWGRAGYATDAPYLTEAGARWLTEHGTRLVGIDSVSIDDIQAGGRHPAHSILLRAGIPVVEHLTGLGQLPPTGFRFTAAPIPLAGFGSFPARAYATIPRLDIAGRRCQMRRRGSAARLEPVTRNTPCAETSDPGGPEPALPARPCHAIGRISRTAATSRPSRCATAVPFNVSEGLERENRRRPILDS